MESANLHHQHQLQHQLGSSPLATPPGYGTASTHAWSTSTILINSGDLINPSINGIIINSSRDSSQQNDILVPCPNSPIIQNLGFHWASNGFTETINNVSNIEDFKFNPTSYAKNELKDLNDPSEKLILSTFSSGCQMNGIQLSARDHTFNAQNCATTLESVTTPIKWKSQIFPTVNISNLNQWASSISSPLDLNLQALDLFSPGRFYGNLRQPSYDDFGIFEESVSYDDADHMEQSSNRPSNFPTKISPFANGVAEAKRHGNFLEPKASQAGVKKSRSEKRSTCEPFKVKKEKLRDRIAYLQQLVAPLGKTDTASVLMEATGYIKFLQNQVQTLSVPHIKSSCNKPDRRMQEDSRVDGNKEQKRDLRSRGLCLVPLSCLSYVCS